LTPFEEGYLVGILMGEGHFGGDGKKAQITLRMHVKHEKLFLWLLEKFPASKLYGPYNHGGRHYYQWMARGTLLKEEILPLLLKNMEVIDDHVKERINEMCNRYKLITTDKETGANEEV
jgi:hypothetical protein